MLISALVLFVVSLGYGVVVPILPELAGTGGSAASPEALSIVYASYSAAKIGCQVPGGVWVDRAGARRVALTGSVLFSLSLVLFLFRFGPTWFAVARTLEGAGTGLVYPAVFARVLRGSDASTHGRMLGRTIGIGSAGLLVGPVLALVLRPWGLRVPILTTLALSVVVLAVVALRFEGREECDAPKKTLSGDLRALLSLGKSAAFLVLIVPVAFNKLTFSAYQGLLPLVASDTLAVGQAAVAGLFVEIGLLFGVSQPIAGVLADRTSPKRVAVFGLVVEATTLVALYRAHTLVVFAVAFGLHIVAQSLVFTSAMKAAATRFGSKDSYGGLVGMLATWTDTMTIVGPLVFLNVYAAVGMGVFAAMAGVCAIATGAYAIGARERADAS